MSGHGDYHIFKIKAFNDYAKALIMESNYEISEYWINTAGGIRATTLEPSKFVYRFEDKMKTYLKSYINFAISWMKGLEYDSQQILAYNWFIGKLIEVKVNKISTTNLRVYSMIARHMLDGIDEKEKRMIFDLMLDKGAELVDMKQCEWQELCISQEFQLPF